MPALTLAELQAHLGGIAQGNLETSVVGAASLESAGPEHLSFIVSRKYLPLAQASQAGILIVPEGLQTALDTTCLVVPNPHASFAQALALLHPEPRLPMGIHPSAVVAVDAYLGNNVSVGPGAVIGPGVRIGDDCSIGAHCYIGDAVTLGSGCLLHPRVTIQHGCQVGDRVVLQPGCVIGADGFGLAWEGDHWSKVPQVGRVIIGNDVEVGANTTVDRGALDDTVLEDGVKLDNLIQIAHNCRIGRHTAIAGCVGIAGSTHIGAYCQIGGAAMIIGHLNICDRVTVSAGSFVAKDIKTPGVYTSVQPLMAHDDWKKNAAHLRHLDALSKRLRALEKSLKDKE